MPDECPNELNEYGKAAVKAVGRIKQEGLEPPEAWRKAVAACCRSPSSQAKSCPRGAFLGLCEEGLISDVRSGTYTRSRKNKEYAVRAVSILRRESARTPPDTATLWRKVLGDERKTHNNQMDVVLALWNKGFILH